MNQTALAINRVADKRHAKLCETMTEAQAAGRVVRYLNSMARIHKASPGLVAFIEALKYAYSINI